LSRDEFDEIMALPPRSFWDYPSYAKFYRGSFYLGIRRIYRLLRAGIPGRSVSA